MELVVLMLIAGVGGYLLANTRASKRIDDTGEKVVDVTRSVADRAENGVRRIFKRKPLDRQDDIIEGQVIETPPAEKQASRRKETEE